MVKYITLFLLVFDVAIPSATFMPSSFITLVIALFFIVVKHKKNNRVVPMFREVIFIYLCMFSFVFIRVAFSSDQSFLLSMIKALIILFASLAYLFAFYDNKTESRLLNVFFINALICFFFGTFQEFKFIIDPFQYNDKLIGFNPYRNSFFSGSGYFGIAIPYIFLFCYYFHSFFYRESFNKFNIFKLLCVFFAAILAGRISVPIFALFFVYMIVKTGKLSLVISVLVFIVIAGLLLQSDSLITVNEWISEMFSADSSITESSSITSLKEMFSIPKNDVTFFIGDGVFQQSTGDYYMNTDVGFLRHWYFWGIFFMMLPFFIMPILYKKNKSTFYIYFLFPIVILFHTKGVALINNPSLMPVIFIVSYCLYSNKKLLHENTTRY